MSSEAECVDRSDGVPFYNQERCKQNTEAKLWGPARILFTMAGAVSALNSGANSLWIRVKSSLTFPVAPLILPSPHPPCRLLNYSIIY